MSGYEKSPDYGVPFSWFRLVQALVLIGLLTAALVWASNTTSARLTVAPGTVVQSIYWSDGDSGRLDGVKFRLANVDAPETGGVGARGGAKCESERELGFLAKEYVVELTRDADLMITANYGTDRYDRVVVDLALDGADLAQTAIAAGHLAAWPHEGRKALQSKPGWC